MSNVNTINVKGNKIQLKYLNVTSIRIKLIEEKEKKFITEKFLKHQDSDPHQSDPNLQR